MYLSRASVCRQLKLIGLSHPVLSFLPFLPTFVWYSGSVARVNVSASQPYPSSIFRRLFCGAAFSKFLKNVVRCLTRTTLICLRPIKSSPLVQTTSCAENFPTASRNTLPALWSSPATQYRYTKEFPARERSLEVIQREERNHADGELKGGKTSTSLAVVELRNDQDGRSARGRGREARGTFSVQ